MNFHSIINLNTTSILYIGNSIPAICKISEIDPPVRITIITELNFSDLPNLDLSKLEFLSEKKLWDNEVLEMILDNFLLEAKVSYDAILISPPQISFSKFIFISKFLKKLSNENTQIIFEVFLAVGWLNEYVNISTNQLSTIFLPTQPLFERMFSEFSLRLLPMNFTERKYSYLLKNKKTVITLIGGKGNSGKTSRARIEHETGAILISLDKFLGAIDITIDNCQSMQLSGLVKICFDYRIIQSKNNPGLKIYQSQEMFAEYLLDNSHDEFLFKSLNSIISGDFDHYVIEGGLLYNKKLKSNFLIFLKNQGYDAWDLIHEI